MGQILVRNLDDAVIDRLKANATGAGVSLEQSVREILTEATRPSHAEIVAQTDRIRAMSTPSPDADSTKILREWRDHGRDDY
jgi:plasmid stability protein